MAISVHQKWKVWSDMHVGKGKVWKWKSCCTGPRILPCRTSWGWSHTTNTPPSSSPAPQRPTLRPPWPWRRRSAPPWITWVVVRMILAWCHSLFEFKSSPLEIRPRQPIAVSNISVYICLINIRDGSCKPVYGGVDRLKALSSAKTGCRSRFFMN